MADRFVSAGTSEEAPERGSEWLAAQQELDAKALQRKQAEAKHGTGMQDDGRTLYEVLQANKATKQDAFEESIKLKNQFRSLDEDEIDFLDEVLDSTRRKEAEVKKDTTEQLEAFRRQREEAERAAAAVEGEGGAEEEVMVWKAGPRKKRKGTMVEKEPLKGVKLRKMSSNAGDDTPRPVTDGSRNASKAELPIKESIISTAGVSSPSKEAPSPRAGTKSTSPAPTPTVGLGLDAYSSDDD